MAIIERDVVLQGKTKEGETTINLPITALKNVEDTADVKETPTETDYIPIIDSSDNGQMKKLLYKKVKEMATYTAFKGATTTTTGKTGLVPAPSAGAQSKFLRGDSTWQALNYLPLSGGTIKGSLTVQGDINSGDNKIYGKSIEIVTGTLATSNAVINFKPGRNYARIELWQASSSNAINFSAYGSAIISKDTPAMSAPNTLFAGGSSNGSYMISTPGEITIYGSTELNYCITFFN